jgi:hypothetical protein
MSKDLNKHQISTELRIVYITRDGSVFVDLEEAIRHSKRKKYRL